MKKESKFTRAACYIRVSTENQIENYSIEEQIKRAKAYCLSKDWGIYKVYTDPGYSGGNIDRPALTDMINDIHDRKIDVVIVYKLDRLSRSQKDTLMLIEDEFLKNGVEFVSINESFDTSTPFGRAMIGILSVFAQLEKDQITERFTMGRIGRSKAGYYHGGPTPPTGYNYVDGDLIVDDYKSLQVQEVFNRFLSGYSINSIQRYMHEKYGGWNSHPLIINILRNSVYTGKVKFGKQEYNGKHKPIISKETFDKVQMLLKSEEREAGKNSAQKTPFRASYLLTSLVYCNKCGARYSGNHGYYKCYSRSKSDKKYIFDPNCKNKNWEIDKLDKIIISEIGQLRQDHKYINNLFSNKEKEPGINLKALDARIKSIDKEISKLIDLYQIDSIPIDQIKSKVDELNKEKVILNEKLSVPVEDTDKSMINFINILSGFDNVFKSDSIEQKRLFVSSVIKSVVLDDENININWRI